MIVKQSRWHCNYRVFSLHFGKHAETDAPSFPTVISTFLHAWHCMPGKPCWNRQHRLTPLDQKAWEYLAKNISGLNGINWHKFLLFGVSGLHSEPHIYKNIHSRAIYIASTLQISFRGSAKRCNSVPPALPTRGFFFETRVGPDPPTHLGGGGA